MMTKNKSKQIKKAKYLLLLPMLLSMLVYTSCDQNQIDEANNTELNNSKIANPKSVDKLPYFIVDEVELSGDKKSVESQEFHSWVRNLVLQNFNSTIINNINLNKHGFKIYSVFDVNAKGKIENIKIRAPHPELKKETERVLNLLSTLVPAKKDGKFIAMRYTLPISYNFGKSNNEVSGSNYYKDDVPYAIIEEVPVYPGCVGTRAEKAACLNMKIKKFTMKNFNVGLSKELGLSKGAKKIWTIFRIDKKGNVVDVKARAPHPKLKEEAERVARMLPKMEPGKQRGKPVGMKYTLPISFVVE